MKIIGQTNDKHQNGNTNDQQTPPSLDPLWSSGIHRTDRKSQGWEERNSKVLNLIPKDHRIQGLRIQLHKITQEIHLQGQAQDPQEFGMLGSTTDKGMHKEIRECKNCEKEI